MAKPIPLSEMMQQAFCLSVATMPDEVSVLFREHFDICNYKWRIDPHTVWENLDRLIGCTYFENSEYYYYFNDEEQRILAMKCLSWLITVFQNNAAEINELAYAFELVNSFPLFWHTAKAKNFSFPQSLRVYALSVTLSYKCNFISSLNHRKSCSLNLCKDLENSSSPCLDDIYDDHQYNFDSLQQSHTCIKQFLHFLAWYYPHELINIINQEQDKWRLLSWLTFLPEPMYIDFAQNLDNKLATFMILTNFHHFFVDGDFESLSKIWDKVDHKTFINWMNIFNRNPQRFSYLQKSLGYFLAHADFHYLAVYVDSLNMYTKAENISDMLHTFFMHADKTRQKEFSQIAYDKWSKWDCPPMLGCITRSPLDEVIIFYFEAIEDITYREEFISERIDKIISYSSVWFKDVVEEEKYLWKLLSQLQPALIASQIVTNPALSTADFLNTIVKPQIFQQDLRLNHRLVPLE